MNVETHLLGSSDGYRTLAKSPGLLPGEEAALTVLNFGQVESSDLAQTQCRSRHERAIAFKRPVCHHAISSWSTG